MSTHESLLTRSLRRLRRAWSELGSTLRGERQDIDPALGEEDAARLRQAIRDCLGSPGGDYARRAQAARIGQSYLSLNRAGRERFWRLLVRDLDSDPAAIRSAIDDYLQAAPGSDEARRRHRLREALVAPRAQLLTLFNALPEGIKFLVDMRGELLAAGATADPELHALEQDLKQLLASWFDIGFLQLRRIDWNTPAAFLEKLIEHEAVHAITSWADLKNRLASDRRLYAFVHPNMAEEPLIFLQVALCDALATSVQALLDTDAGTLDNDRADTAIFYSISNAQRGLAGISFGNYLIRRVVADLKRELPGLRRFATLSPVPGFAAWLRERPGLVASPPLGATEREALDALAARHAVSGPGDLLALPEWSHDEALALALRPALLRLCARYLCEHAPGKARALDAVAHFHLGNGATLQQLDWMADTSAKGLAQSCGIMVNYLYEPRTIDANSESYALQGSIATSPAIRELLREPPR